VVLLRIFSNEATTSRSAGLFFYSRSASVRVFGDAEKKRLLIGNPRSDSSFRQTKTTAAYGERETIMKIRERCAFFRKIE